MGERDPPFMQSHPLISPCNLLNHEKGMGEDVQMVVFVLAEIFQGLQLRARVSEVDWTHRKISFRRLVEEREEYNPVPS